MGLISNIKNRIEKKRMMKIVEKAKEDEKIPEEERKGHSFGVHYRSAVREAERMSDEQAIDFYKEKGKEFDKTKQLYDRVKEILEKNGLGMPPSYVLYDGDIKQAKYILHAKGLDIQEIDLGENKVTTEEIKSKLKGAFMGIIGQMEYYCQPQENMKKMGKLFEKILKEEFGEDVGKQEQEKETEDLLK